MRLPARSQGSQSGHGVGRLARGWGRAGLLAGLLLFSAIAAGVDGKLSVGQRDQIIRAFLAEEAFVHRTLPRGRAGVRIEEGKISPSEAEMDQLVARSGAAAKPGERVKITAVRFVRQGILFEINGGPVKRKRWQDRVSVGMSSDAAPGAAQGNESVYTESDGSSVLLVLKDGALKDGAGISPDQIKERLAPVLDFKAMTQAEAYQKSLPPVLAAAVKEHHALVGMDKEMVLSAVGRPLRRLRETSDGQEYEEWIYGTPPQDVEFVRFVGGKVVRIEEMKVTGEKRVRTQDEVGAVSGVLEGAAQKQARPEAMAAPSAAAEEERSAPTLLRPGEKMDGHGEAARAPRPQPATERGSPPAN
jgi:hypothetical protein